MERMLVVSEKYLPKGGGAELATHLILNLLKEDYEITVLTGTSGQLSCLTGVRYVHAELLDVPNKLLLWKNLLALSRMSWFTDLVKANDVIYVPRISYLIIPTAKKLGKRVVVHLHDYQPVSYSSILFENHKEIEPRGLFKDAKDSILIELEDNESVLRAALASTMTSLNRLIGSSVSQADRIICVSDRQRDIMTNLIPEIAKKTGVVLNPPPLIPLYRKRLGTPNFLFLGGPKYAKGLHVITRPSVGRFLGRAKAKFTLTGIEGKKLAELRRLNNSLGDPYLLLGRLPYSEILGLYERASALIVPSIWEEPFGYVVVESMLSGTIPIGSRVGGIPEIVQGTFAEKLLFECGNDTELLERMNFILSLSADELLKTGVELREHILRKLDPQRLKQDYLHYFGGS